MAVIENRVLIERSAEVVFDYLVDMRHELEWNPQCRSMHKIGGDPIGLGTKFLAKWKQSPLIEVECTEFDRPRAWQYTNGGPIAVVFDVTLTPEGGGTRLSSHFVAQPNGPIKLIFPLVLRSLRRAEKNNMQYIKEALESAPVATGDERDGASL